MSEKENENVDKAPDDEKAYNRKDLREAYKAGISRGEKSYFSSWKGGVPDNLEERIRESLRADNPRSANFTDTMRLFGFDPESVVGFRVMILPGHEFAYNFGKIASSVDELGTMGVCVTLEIGKTIMVKEPKHLCLMDMSLFDKVAKDRDEEASGQDKAREENKE